MEMATCWACDKKAVIKDYRNIDRTTGKYPSCAECFNKDTLFLLRRIIRRQNEKAGNI